MSKINMLRSCKGSVYWMAPEVKVAFSPFSCNLTTFEQYLHDIPWRN
jgi:hypothetical protein